MLSEVEEAKRLIYSRRLNAQLTVRQEDQEDEILDALAAGATITTLRPYRPTPGGALSRAYPDGARAGSSGAGSSSAGGEVRSVGAEDRIRRGVERETRRRRLRRSGAEAGERWIEGRAFPWGEKERGEITEALGSGGEESEGEGERFGERVGKVLEAAEMVMEDVDDEVKVCAVFCCF